MRRRLGVAPVGVLLLVALSACGQTDKANTSNPVPAASQSIAVATIEPRAIAALVVEAVPSQGRPEVVSIAETEASTSVHVHWSESAPVTMVRVVLSDEPSVSGTCETVSKECEDGTSEGGDFVILRSSEQSIEGFRQSRDGSSLTMTSYGDGSTFDVVRTLVLSSDLARTVPVSVNEENQWQGHVKPLRTVSSVTKVRR